MLVQRQQVRGTERVAVQQVAQQHHIVFFVSVPPDRIQHFGPPYGKAWGYWKKYGERWPPSARLSDDEIIRVNAVKLHADYFKVDPVDVVRLHAGRGGDRDVVVRTFEEKKLGGPKSKDHGNAAASGMASPHGPPASHGPGGGGNPVMGHGGAGGGAHGKGKGKP